MKYRLIIIVLLFSSFGFGLKYAYDQFKNMGLEIVKLKTSNKNLQKNNKKLVGKNTNLKKRNKSLVTKTSTLTNEKNRLKARHKNMHKKFADRRNKITSLKYKKVGTKLASSGLKMVPFVGVSAIVADTALDVQGYCEEIEAMKKLEVELFGSTESVNDNNDICGIDVESVLHDTASDINSSYDSLLKSFDQQQIEAVEYIKQKYNDVSNKIFEDGNDTWTLRWFR